MMNSPNMQAIATETVTAPKPSSKNKVKANMLAYRGMILYRFILAGAGGYLLATLATIVIAQLFIDSGSSAAMSATLIGFSLNTARSEEHTSELQSRENVVCRLLLEKQNK